MEFMSWLHHWLARHPMKTPTQEEQRRSTASVMERVRVIGPHQHDVPAQARWSWAWPRFAIAVATIALVVGIVRVSQPLRRQLAQQPHQAAPTRPETKSAVPQTMTDDEWVDQTLKLLDQLDEEVVPDASTESEDEPWLKELELLDERDLSNAS